MRSVLACIALCSAVACGDSSGAAAPQASNTGPSQAIPDVAEVGAVWIPDASQADGSDVGGISDAPESPEDGVAVEADEGSEIAIESDTQGAEVAGLVSTTPGKGGGTAVCAPCEGMRPYCAHLFIDLPQAAPFFVQFGKVATEDWHFGEINEFCTHFAPDALSFDAETESLQWVDAYEPCSGSHLLQVQWFGECTENAPNFDEPLSYRLVRASNLCCDYQDPDPDYDWGKYAITFFRVPKDCGVWELSKLTIDVKQADVGFDCFDWPGKTPVDNGDIWSFQ
ncbi:MAG: hypothetical protein ACI9WU_002106 [Myxococcota bacterium]|jgi:hypothetical protein